MVRSLVFSKYCRIPLSALALSMAAVVAFYNSAAAESPGIPGVLILRNGSVLMGAVRRYGDDYRIDVAGAMLQVPADQVDMFSQTLEEAYELRRRDRTGTSADSHLELARWCMQLDLLSQAARELLDARTIDPRHSALPGLETRLRQMIDLKNPDSPDGLDQPPHESSTTFDRSGHAKAGAEEAPREAPPFDVSEEAQSQFVRSIQPMLVRSCTTGGCHQPSGTQSLKLDRWALEGNGNAEMVLRNLASVLGAVNVDDPSSSSLLQWARQSHGGKSGAASKPLAAYQTAILLEWINDAAGVVPAEALEGSEAALPASNESLEGNSANGEAVEEVAISKEVQASFEPRDAFDPEIFNRRAASDAAASDGQSQGQAEDQSEDKAPVDESSEPSLPAVE